jgi:hypothetical protein
MKTVSRMTERSGPSPGWLTLLVAGCLIILTLGLRHRSLPLPVTPAAASKVPTFAERLMAVRSSDSGISPLHHPRRRTAGSNDAWRRFYRHPADKPRTDGEWFLADWAPDLTPIIDLGSADALSVDLNRVFVHTEQTFPDLTFLPAGEAETLALLWDPKATALNDSFSRFHRLDGTPVAISPETLRGEPQAGGLVVHTSGHWWPASVLVKSDHHYLVRYAGHGPEADEWVTAERMAVCTAVKESEQE